MLSEEAIGLLKWFAEGERTFKMDQGVYERAFEELDNDKLIFLDSPKMLGGYSIIVVRLTARGKKALEKIKEQEGQDGRD